MQFLVGRFVILTIGIGCASQLWAQSETRFQGDHPRASIRPADMAAGSITVQPKQGNAARIKLPTTASHSIISDSSSAGKPAGSNIKLSMTDEFENPSRGASTPINEAQSIPTNAPFSGKNASRVRQAAFMAAGRQSSVTQETDQDQTVFFPEARTDPIYIEPQDKVLPAPFRLQTSTTPSPSPLPMLRENTILQPPARGIPAQQFSSRQESLPPPPPLNARAGEAHLPARNPTASGPNYVPFSEQQMRLMQQPAVPTVSEPPPTSYPPADFQPDDNFEWQSFDNREKEVFGIDYVASPQMNLNWGLFHATAFVGNNSLRDFGIRRGGAIQNVEASDGFLGGLQLGINHGRNLRADYELSYRTNDIATQAMPNPFLLPNAELLNGEMSAFSGLGNFYWDFADINVFGIKPYVGAGLGFAYFDVDLRDRVNVSAINPAAQNNSNLAYQWIIGVNGQATRSLDWFVEYRYYNGGEIQFELNENYFGPRSLTNGDYVSNSVLAGFKFKF